MADVAPQHVGMPQYHAGLPQDEVLLHVALRHAALPYANPTPLRS